METRQVSDRITISKNRDSTRIEITQKIENWKMWLLRSWLVAWLFVGGVFLYNALIQQEDSGKILLLIIIGFWSFFLFRIGKALLWRARGKEIILIEPQKMWIQNAIGKAGRRQSFNLPHVKALGKIKEKNEFMAFMDNSFWIIGGDKLGFNYNGRRFQLGKQLNDKDVRALAQILEKSIREFGKRAVD